MDNSIQALELRSECGLFERNTVNSLLKFASLLSSVSSDLVISGHTQARLLVVILALYKIRLSRSLSQFLRSI